MKITREQLAAKLASYNSTEEFAQILIDLLSPETPVSPADVAPIITPPAV